MFKAEYIFVRILLAFIPGIIVFYFVENSQWIIILSVIYSLLFCGIFCINRYYKTINAYKFKGYTGILIFSFFFAFGGLLCLLNKENLNPNYFATQKFDALKVSVADEPEINNYILRFKAKVLSAYHGKQHYKSAGKILIAIQLDSLSSLKLKYGDEILIGNNFTEVEPPYNPAESNFKAWLSNQNVYHQIFIKQNDAYKLNLNSGNPIIKYALNLREKQILKYRILIKDDEAFAVASTLILGYRANLSQETLAIYSKTGTIHALSVSGAHVAIIYVVLNFLLSFLDKKRKLQIVKLILICSLIWGYALITGLSASVVRSAIMITIFIIAKTYSKNTNGYNILAFAAFCQLLFNPFLIWDVGFQLSYIAVFGLIYLQPRIYILIYIKNKWIDKLWNITALSLAAQIVTFPLSVYYFHQFPVYFLLANLFILIPLTVIMYLGILVLVPILSALAPIFEWVIIKTNWVLNFIANLPLSTLTSIWINLPALLLLTIALGLFIYGLDNRKSKIFISSITCFSIFLAILSYHEIKSVEQEKIIYFSLRKNYAVAFINGNNAIIETDLISNEKTFNYFVKPCLDSLKISSISLIKLEKDTISAHFIKSANQIVFKNYRILIVDSTFNYKTLNNTKASFTSIWLRNTPKFDLRHLQNQIKFDNMIIDGSNKQYKVQEFTQFADSNKIEKYILKKNKAYLANIKP